MALTLEVVGKGFRLKSADNKREFDVSPAQAKAWQEILDRRAREQGLKNSKELLENVKVAVPEAGDSQFKIGKDNKLSDADTMLMIGGNVQFSNPDLINAYHQGSLHPDFVLVPTMKPAGAPAAIDALKAPASTADHRKAAVKTYLGQHSGNVEERTNAAVSLMDSRADFGSPDMQEVRLKEIMDVLVEPYEDEATRRSIVGALKQHSWSSHDGQGLDGQKVAALISGHARTAYGIH
ncbi:hypothetical protein [Ciceribacter thiooxidans]|uniref:Uncharacterized protein n=1 Tax=Ciceribacter thiooxidans TaxID=1969821 RepID=A0ABV7IAV2_9HYPH|nr:hypothetical protein [Ciceribacter thiooxidans]MDI6838845.1 hypothetical protein [Rhizobiaceae bacterium]